MNEQFLNVAAFAAIILPMGLILWGVLVLGVVNFIRDTLPRKERQP